MTAATAAAAAPGGTRASGAAAGLRPARAEAADAGLLLILTAVGMVGFRATYGGHDYLVVGVAGAALGIALSHVGNRARLPLLTVTGLGLLAFILLGGLVPQAGGSSVLPTLSAMRDVASASVGGWKELLTTARPVGTAAHLLVLPYLLGLASGVAGFALARRTARPMLPAAAPAGVVALSILFGADHATAALLQGAVFAGLALAWAALRQQRGAGPLGTVGRQRPWQRAGSAAAVLVVAVAGAAVIGPRLPGAGSHGRVVLQAVPPSQFSAYPSPLAGFRDYTKDAAPSVGVWGKRLLSTSGLPAGSLVQIAVMDTYNGLVWGVSNAAANTMSFAGFQRIGSTLAGQGGAAGPAVTITVDPAYQLPWLPDLAGARRFQFAGAAGRAVQAALRFNVATGTGVVPAGLPAGLRYTVMATGSKSPTAAQLANAAPYGAPDAAVVMPAAVTAFAGAHAASGSPVRRVLALAAYLKEHGSYSDGGAGQADVRAGHSTGRLTAFLGSAQIIGDDEQYAAAMALLADAVGVPARVALDGTVESGGAVYGKDVHADVQLRLAGYGWVTLPSGMFTGRKTAVPQPQTTPPPAPAKVVPPPASNAAPITQDANQSNTVARSAPPGRGPFQLPAIVAALLGYVGLPLLALAMIGAALVAAKALRRRHRRRTGPAATRCHGAWLELLDLGRDLGIERPANATRREFARTAERGGIAGALVVARAADAAAFRRDEPDDVAVTRVWTLAEQARRNATGPLARWRRAWVAVNPASLWASRPARTRRPARPGRPGLSQAGARP